MSVWTSKIPADEPPGDSDVKIKQTFKELSGNRHLRDTVDTLSSPKDCEDI